MRETSAAFLRKGSLTAWVKLQNMWPGKEGLDLLDRLDIADMVSGCDKQVAPS